MSLQVMFNFVSWNSIVSRLRIYSKNLLSLLIHNGSCTIMQLHSITKSGCHKEHRVIMSAASANLKVLMIKHEMKAMDLARKIDISPSMVGLILKDKTNPSIDSLTKLAGLFDIDPSYLICPYFNDQVQQAEVDRLLESFLSPALDDNQRGSIIQFAEFQHDQTKK